MPDMMRNVLTTEWAVPEPYRVRPLAHGTNNSVRLVETSTGSYVLRIYSNHADARRLRFEHTVLAHLQAAELPFGLPVPIPTRSGALYASAADGTNEALAVLTPFLPGEHPNQDDLAQARAGGAALGQLDVALACIPPLDAVGAVSWRSYGDLAHCHPLVPDPRSAIIELPLPGDTRDRLIHSYDMLIEHIPSLYARLPQQLVHEDYAPDNLLMRDARVTGVLDFEFCSRDVRMMDLTVALSWWPTARFGTGAEWPIIQAVAEGYARHVTLTAAEIEAMPALYQLRAYTSLIHRLGRYRQGLSPLPAVTDRALAALEREDWLARNRTHLVETVLACVVT